MQDRFKFRYWYKPLKIMVNIQDKDYFFEIAHNDKYTVMQCTGLKDKNGKLIYEGDILRLKDIKIPVEVRFKGIGFELYAEPTNMAGYHNDKYIPEDSEIIGNIYENKDLL